MNKKNNKNLEKNISRLTKLTTDTNEPNENFVDNLINEAVNQLDQPRVKGAKSMKLTLKSALALAAMILVVASIAFTIFVPKLNKSQNFAVHSEEKEAAIKRVTTRDAKIVIAQNKPQPPAKISSKDKYAKLGDKPILNEMVTALPGRPEAMSRACKNITAGTALCYDGSITYGVNGDAVGRMAHGGTTPPNGEPVDAMFFKNYGVNPFVDTEDDHFSTFAMDVDTGSYTISRSYLQQGNLPPEKAVRVEEFVNYFVYDYTPPEKETFALYTEAAPWAFGTGRKNSYLLSVSLVAKQISPENRKPAILTFVIDVSGSMGRENRLGLVKKSLRMLVDNLKPEDKIGIAVYGSTGQKILDHKGLNEKDVIVSAIEALQTDGSTNAEEGIRIGYEMAEKSFKAGHINRVILCSDGVANVGRTGPDEILKMIKEKSRKGITLSALGFGMGNYNDVLMEQLGDNGDGYYSYIDTIEEARRLFDYDLTSTLQVVAMDAKIQVDFDPNVVRSYRLIGYENRDVPDEKFRDDKQDGGETGAGHNVTALYELKLWPEKQGKVATVYIRYKNPDTDEVEEFNDSISTENFNKDFDSTTTDFRLAATAAEFAEILRKSYWAKGAELADTLEKARQISNERKDDADITELVDLISKANKLLSKPAE